MKKVVFFILFIWLFHNCVLSQWKVQPTIGISHNWSLFGVYRTDKVASITNYHYNDSYHVTNIPYQVTNVNLGLNIIHNRYSLGIKGSYQYFKCREQLVLVPHVKNKHSIKSRFIGLNIVNRFRETKIIRPFFSIELSTEIGTNYKEKYLDAESYDPVIYFSSLYQSWDIRINYYKSTPFIGNLLVGCDFRLYKGLSVNAAFGYGLRILKTQYGKLYYHPSVQDKPIAETKIGNPYTVGLNYLTLQLGLNYAFSFHKKEKKASE